MRSETKTLNIKLAGLQGDLVLGSTLMEQSHPPTYPSPDFQNERSGFLVQACPKRKDPGWGEMRRASVKVEVQSATAVTVLRSVGVEAFLRGFCAEDLDLGVGEGKRERKENEKKRETKIGRGRNVWEDGLGQGSGESPETFRAGGLRRKGRASLQVL